MRLTLTKLEKYRADYNNDPPAAISFMPDVASTSGRLHSEFVLLLFLQTHRGLPHLIKRDLKKKLQTDESKKKQTHL
jgi:hypothetical protein